MLNIQGLSVVYRSNSGLVKALDNVSLDVKPNELLAVVGESGCGKTTLGLSVIGLLPPNNTEYVKGCVNYKGTDLAAIGQDRMRRYRGTEIAMIFQEPLTSLNPVYKVGDQIAEAVMLRKLRKEDHHAQGGYMQKVYKSTSGIISRLPRPGRKIGPELKEEIVDWLRLVRIADAEQVLDRYPFELSGGMRQRIMIAMALSQEPALLIADEPTTALDVTTQAQVLKLMRELMQKIKTSILLVTHDLAVASQVADRILVMYAGEIAEDSDVYDLFSNPLHPYTQGLLSCIPSGSKENSRLKPIPGSLPDLREANVGCKFADRCPHVMDICRRKRPIPIRTKEKHEVSCFLYGQQ